MAGKHVECNGLMGVHGCLSRMMMHTQVSQRPYEVHTSAAVRFSPAASRGTATRESMPTSSAVTPAQQIRFLVVWIDRQWPRALAHCRPVRRYAHEQQRFQLIACDSPIRRPLPAPFPPMDVDVNPPPRCSPSVAVGLV